MNDTRTHADWIDRTVYDRADNKLGDVSDVYYDDVTGRPEWMTVSTGWFGTAKQFVPIAGTSTHGDDLKIDYAEDLVKDAPSIDTDAHLDADQERKLYAHYGIDYNADPETLDASLRERPRADEGFGYSDTRESDAASVVRAEEQVAVDKVQAEAGRVRLRKYVVTEDVNFTVPVRTEVAKVVREPIEGTQQGAIIDGAASEEEIVLKTEEVVVDKQVVAKERVGVETETVTTQEPVSETVRKERVEVDGEIDPEKG